MTKKKKGNEESPAPVMDEGQKKTEQDQIGKAFDNAEPIPPFDPKAQEEYNQLADDSEPAIGSTDDDPEGDDSTPVEGPKRFVTEPPGPEERRVPRVVSVPYSAEDKAERMDSVSAKVIQRKLLEGEKKEFNDDINERIKTLEKEIDAIGIAMSTGEHKIEVDCIQRYDYANARAIIFRIDNNEIIEDRPLKKGEAQTRMPLPPGEGEPGAFSKTDMEPRGRSSMDTPSELAGEVPGDDLPWTEGQEPEKDESDSEAEDTVF